MFIDFASAEFSQLLLTHSDKLAEDGFLVANGKAKSRRLSHQRRCD
ncbi:Uncharacterised protein [Mycobacterium tuberculosis]|nr:Uncharacterised protein [Mycobacterium tuberculosis]